MKKFDSTKIWFTSDLHFNHKNIIDKFQFRPFKNIYDMEDTIVENWNNFVHKTDTIFILGDLAMHASKKEIKRIFDRLNGFKYLIKGNHDSDSKIPKECFIGVYDLMDIKIEEEKDEIQQITLCHYPMLSWKNSHHDSWQLFGHLHGGDSNKELADDNFSILKCIRPQQLDVGTDPHNFFPVSYTEVKQILKEKGVKTI